MVIQVANRLNNVGEYYFSTKLKEIEELNGQGKDVINLGIGSPDMAPHPDVIEVLHEASLDPALHGYQSYRGSAVLRNAISAWYMRWYQADLDPAREILPLMGSKEGIMHICMTYLNHGDEVLIPDPGYPTYKSCAVLSGATCVEYKLTAETSWLPDLEMIESTDLSKVKLMWVNYPHMPTGASATMKLFEKLIAFGKRNNILICHDNPYSFILNENPLSILSIEGAKDCAIELNSLSKSLNMAGWRVGMLCGSTARINEILVFKSNMDSGMFLPVQKAAAKALSLPATWYKQLNDEYRARRVKVFELLDLLAASYEKDQAGLFIWARIPATHASGYALSDEILYNASVFITPGGIFGSSGENYIRVSLCATVEKFDKAIARIKKNIKK